MGIYCPRSLWSGDSAIRDMVNGLVVLKAARVFGLGENQGGAWLLQAFAQAQRGVFLQESLIS